MTGILRTYVREIVAIFSRLQVFMILILGPLTYAVFYPQPYVAETLRNVPIVVVDNDDTIASRDLIRNVDATPDVAVVDTKVDFTLAKERVLKREASGIMVIPQHFERDLLHGRSSPVVLYADSSYFLIFQRLSTAIRGVTGAAGVSIELARLVGSGVDPSAAVVLADPMPITLVPLFNPQGGYATYVLPAAFVLIVQQILLIGIGMLQQRDHTGTGQVHRRSLSSAFAQAFDEVIGRTLAYLTIEAVIMPFYLVVLLHFYGLPRLGSVTSILILILPFAIAVCGLGIVVASLLRSSLATQLTMASMGMPLFFLAGFAWPMEIMPAPIYALAKLIPSTTAIDAFIRLSQFGASWAEIAVQWRTLLAMAVGYFLLAVIFTAERHYRLPSETGDGERHAERANKPTERANKEAKATV